MGFGRELPGYRPNIFLLLNQNRQQQVRALQCSAAAEIVPHDSVLMLNRSDRLVRVGAALGATFRSACNGRAFASATPEELSVTLPGTQLRIAVQSWGDRLSHHKVIAAHGFLDNSACKCCCAADRVPVGWLMRLTWRRTQHSSVLPPRSWTVASIFALSVRSSFRAHVGTWSLWAHFTSNCSRLPRPWPVFSHSPGKLVQPLVVCRVGGRRRAESWMEAACYSLRPLTWRLVRTPIPVLYSGACA